MPTRRTSSSYLLYPFSLLYGMVIYIRNLLFDIQLLKSHEFPIPIISVGNLTVGGTGKTPHIEYLVSLLKDEFRVATLSRGYKRKSRGFILAGSSSTVRDIGDEPMQIKQKFPEIEVAVDRRRVNGIRKLLSRVPDLDVILLDDAYQHRYVKPGLSILLIDFTRPVSEDLLLPAGRLREHAFERRRAHIILITKCPDRLKPIERRLIVKDLRLYPFQDLFFTKLSYAAPIPVFSDHKNPLNLHEIKSLKPQILMVAGIAGPRHFKKHLRSISTRITDLIYPDHHDFRLADMEKIRSAYEDMEGTQKIIFTTEKDAMRMQKFKDLDPAFRNKMYYIPVGIRILNEDTEEFNQRISNYVSSNKRNSILYQKQDQHRS